MAKSSVQGEVNVSDYKYFEHPPKEVSHGLLYFT
jgi:hypothetical protein